VLNSCPTISASESRPGFVGPAGVGAGVGDGGVGVVPDLAGDAEAVAAALRVVVGEEAWRAGEAVGVPWQAASRQPARETGRTALRHRTLLIVGQPARWS
jgi:hypothetical protein